MRRDPERIFLLGFALVIAILVSVGFFAFANARQLVRLGRVVDQNIRTIVALDELTAVSSDTEKAALGYLLGGGAPSLTAYQSGRSRLAQILIDLAPLVSDDAIQRTSRLQLAPLLERELRILQTAVDRRSDPTAAAGADHSTSSLPSELGAVREALGTMKTREMAELELHRRERAEIDRRVTFAAAIGVTAALLIALTSVELRRRGMRLRRQALEALRESEARFRTLAENVAAALFIVQDDRFRYVNPATAALSGYTIEELASIDLVDLVDPEHRELVRRSSHPRTRGGQAPSRCEIKVVARDGTIRWGDVSTAVIQHEGRPAVVGLAYDVTERKRAEQQLERQLERLSALRTIDSAITGSVDLRTILHTLLSESCRQLHLDAAAALLLDSNTQTLDFGAACGFRTPALQHTHLRVGEGFAGRAAMERRLIQVAALSAEDSLARSPLLAEEEFVAYLAVPLLAKGQVRGVLEIFHRAPLETDDEWLTFLETLAGQAAIAIDDSMLFNELQRSNTELLLAYDSTIEGWSRALDLRDRETEGHTRRVTELTLRLARSLGISSTELVQIRRGALLHDIGKMGIPDAVLLKSGPLTEEEWKIMRRHPQMAYDLLSPILYLRPALDIPYCHHEWWDGTGYPRALSGEGIPPSARMFAVADVWDAITSKRPYRDAWGERWAREYLVAQAGIQFEPRMVDAFLAM